MFTSASDHFTGHVSVVDKNGNTIHEGDICKAVSDPREAFPEADMIMITMPPTMMIPLSEIIYDNTDAHTMIGFVPGNGGFELAFSNCIERGNVLFGIDRVPAIARITKRGQTVCCSGYKDELYVGAIPSEYTETCAALIESIYDIPCVRLPGFMALTLTPSNPILHTARLKVIFGDYKPGVTYEKLPLFYEEWDDESSALLLACDDEIQEICRKLPDFGLEYVVSEREFYHADTPEEMTAAISTEESLMGLTTPSVPADSAAVKNRGLWGLRSGRQQQKKRIQAHMDRISRWKNSKEACSSGDQQKCSDAGPAESCADRHELIPDLHSRYFTADFPYGLSVIKQIGDIAGAETPHLDGLLDWYDSIAIINDRLDLSDYGITNLEELRSFYLR
jgi:hypothetical protein